jgi:hypothetical protein
VTPPLSTLASLVAEDFATAHRGVLDDAATRDLAHRIETALRTTERLERDACAELCAARTALWSPTGERAGVPASLRSESRARANEAAFLGDAIRARSGA